jgi:hypothetical protein
MKTQFLSILLLSMMVLVSCENKTDTEGKVETLVDSIPADKTKVIPEDTAGVMVKENLKLSPLVGSPEFADATLELNTPEENAKLKSGERVKFSYDIKNYELKSQTPNKSCNECNNSKDGQHIHLILNNDPYIAIYQPQFDTALKDGHYVALSFLSRSYHESIKSFDAFDLRQFTVGKTNAEKVDLTQPLLFYSRPKGEYKGEFAKRILLDFYLVNTDLSPDGKKVRATINGTEFIIPKWQPYIIEGLPMGESTVKIELIDKDGKLVDSPFNKVERKITLKPEVAG